MTTAPATHDAPAQVLPSPVARSLRRLTGMATAEMRMLLRNKVAFFYAVAMAPLMVLMLMNLPMVTMLAESMPHGGLATMITTTLVLMGLSLAVYYNLTTAVVARRESLVLKRLRSGSAHPAEILASVALPNVFVLLAQTILVLAATCAAFGAPAFTNPLLVLVGLGLGAVFFSICAFQTGVSTRTVEASQLTTMPGVLLFMGISGMVVPLSSMPERVESLMHLLPVVPVSELVMLGLNGTTMDGRHLGLAETWAAAAQPVAVMVAWTIACGWYLRRTMAWEPRR